ncbi:MAG: sulfatase [Methylococcales bacterium]
MKVCPVVTLILALWSHSPTILAETGKPNIILIVLDTLRADRLSLSGYPRRTTPNIEAFARDSVVYSKAHSVAPWTLPSHMSMFTGWMPSRHGADWNAYGHPEDMDLEQIVSGSFKLSEPSRLLAVKLKKNGYKSAAFSSNAWVSVRTGMEEGFDEFREMWKVDTSHRKYFEWAPPGLRKRSWFPEGYRGISEFDFGDAGLVIREFKDFLSKHDNIQEAPWFLFFNFIDPHYPYSPPASWRYRYSDDVELGERIATFEFSEFAMDAGQRPVDVRRFNPFYDGEISYVDDAIGRLLEILIARGLYQDTLIILTSDHGEHLGEKGHFSHQFSVEEELLWVPLVIKFPGNQGSGTVIDNPLVSTLDLYQTALSAAGLESRDGSSDTASKDLSDMQNFHRRYLLAEYSYSLPYLKASHKAYSGFDIAANRVTRRVVYDGRERHVFIDSDLPLNPATSVVAEHSKARQAAEDFLQSFLQQLPVENSEHSEEEIDEKNLERLRSLGYVE